LNICDVKLSNGNVTRLYSWIPAGQPRSAVKIIHGMCEHCGRYDGFAKALVAEGYAVYANDLRGHGELAKEHLGYHEGNMWDGDVDDQKCIIGMIKEKYPDIPVYVFAHSYGSFLCQELIGTFEGVQKYVLSGSCIRDNAEGYGKLLSYARTLPEKALANEINANAFASYNGRFEADGPMAWLSRDIESNKRYVADPYCGFVVSNNFYASMFSGCLRLSESGFFAKSKEKPPVLLVSGDQDPVGEYGQGVVALGKLLEKSGFPTEVCLFPGARHEVLNETNKAEVIEKVKSFLKP